MEMINSISESSTYDKLLGRIQIRKNSHQPEGVGKNN